MEFFEKPRVIVRFHSNIDVPDDKDPILLLSETEPRLWKQLRETYGDIKLAPVFDKMKPEALRDLQKRAVERDPTYVPERLDLFFYADSEEAKDLDGLTKILRSWPAVRSVDVEILGPDPLVNAANDPRWPNQGYLDPAPDGIDAEFAWTVPGGDGAGQRIVDMERGWTFAHEDLTAHGIALLNGTIRDGSRSHGTSVFGEMVAVDNTVGCVGIAPQVASVLATSYWTSSIPNAITAAIAAMDFGDVLILEAQVDVSPTSTQYGPVETIEANYEAIRLATALGIVVVEAGGNGTNNGSAPAVDLDTWQNPAGQRVLWRDPGNADFRDSGAIIVAAATSAAPHTRLAYSTFGARVDCYGWGQNVDTLSSSASGATTTYTGGFSGTSSASPIVAGAALCVQGVCETNHGFRLSPRQMREVLSDPAINTPPAATEATAMGVMPDLRAIIEDQLDITPDVYVRDNTADTGEPHTGSISGSPDIILRPAAIADPQAAYGEGSGTENNAALGFQAEAGQDNFIYVRAQNQGGVDAANTEATVFWSPPSTLVTPDLWTLVGTVNIPNIPTGEVLTVSDAITWPAAEIPAPGHYCFVGIVGTAGDPAPAPADFLNFNNFRAFIRDNNNVTWRNFNVVDIEPDPRARPAGYVALPFLVAGAPDKTRRFLVELKLKTTKKAEVLLDLPLRFLRDFKADLDIVKIQKRKDRAIARLPSGGRIRFGPARIPPKARYDLRLLVKDKAARGKRRVMARQLLNGKEEVGRVTWILAPGVNKRFAAARKGKPIGALG